MVGKYQILVKALILYDVLAICRPFLTHSQPDYNRVTLHRIAVILR